MDEHGVWQLNQVTQILDAIHHAPSTLYALRHPQHLAAVQQVCMSMFVYVCVSSLPVFCISKRSSSLSSPSKWIHPILTPISWTLWQVFYTRYRVYVPYGCFSFRVPSAPNTNSTLAPISSHPHQRLPSTTPSCHLQRRCRVSWWDILGWVRSTISLALRRS